MYFSTINYGLVWNTKIMVGYKYYTVQLDYIWGWMVIFIMVIKDKWILWVRDLEINYHCYII